MTPPGRLCIIHNPVAGHGKSKVLLAAVTGELKRERVPFEVVETQGKGHAVELARMACRDGYDTVVAMGGDGTLSEVVNGILTSDNPSARLAIIPSGTGNDFVWGSRLYRGFDDAVHAPVRGNDRRVDAISVRDSLGVTRFAINSVGIGFDAYVVRRVQDLGSKKIGQLSYMFEALRGLLTFSPGQGSVSLGGSSVSLEDLWMFAVTNSTDFGGGMKVSPDARVDDGLLDCCHLSGVPRSNLVSLVFLVRQGKHLGKKGVFYEKARSVRIDVPEGFPSHIDGDTVDMRYPLEISVMPGALHLRTPA